MTWCLLSVSCAPDATGRDAATLDDHARGLEPAFRLELDRSERDGGRVVRYVIDANGTIAFGGGVDASVGRTSWQGPLDVEDHAAIWSLLERDGWLDGSMKGTGEPRGMRGTVRVRWTGGSRRHTVRGTSEPMDRLIETLEHASRERFERILRELPQAGDPAR